MTCLPATPASHCQHKIALWGSSLFFLLMFFTLCFPQPQGVADNSDMARNSLFVADAPKGMQKFSAPGENPQQARRNRFFVYYLRYWTSSPLKVTPLGKNYEDTFNAAAISSNLPLYLPAYLLPWGSPKGSYDLTLNTFYLILILAGLVYWVLRALPVCSAPLLFASAAGCMLMLCDSGSSRLLNSFYQDCGTYFFFFCLLLYAHALWQRPTPRRCGVFLLLCLLLMLAKATNTPSTLIAFGLLPLAAILKSECIARKKIAVLAVVLLLAGSLLVCGYLLGHTNSPAALNRNFLYNTALPHVPTDQRPAYLQLLGLNPTLSQYSGHTTADVPPEAGIDAQHPQPPNYGRRLHLRSVYVLLRHYPRAFVAIFVNAVEQTGSGYNSFGSREKAFSVDLCPPSGYIHWWELREKYLHGWWSYFVSMVMGLALVITAIRRRDTGQFLFLAIMVNSMILASFSNIALSAYGDWFGDLARHIYFGNRLFDAQFVMGVIGVVYVLWPRRRKRRNRNPSAIA